MIVGLYVGFATVGIFAWWYIYDNGAADGHTLVTLDQLMHWGQCNNKTPGPQFEKFTAKNILDLDFTTDPCSYFSTGKVKASTLSLTVLVVIEMLNAFNALSLDGSLVQMPPWNNPWLILAALGSVGVHFVILYVPVLAKIFNVCALDLHDWTWVMAFSFPVIVIEEVLKAFGRQQTKAMLAETKSKHH